MKVLALIALTAFPGDPPEEVEPLAKSLKDAKADYAKAIDALKSPTLEWLDTQEKANAGKKSALAGLADSRTLFEKNGEPPPGMPFPLRQTYTAAAKRLEGWYETGVREYRKAGLHAKAETVSQEWLQLRIDGRGTLQPEIQNGQPHLIVARCSGLAFTIDPPNGSAQGKGVVQRTPNDQDDAQHWYVSMERVGSTALFSFKLKRYDLWMHVDGASHNNGAVMLLWPGTGKERHARWIALLRGSWLNLQSAESGLLIGVPEGRKTSGTHIIQWSTTMEDDQRLRILPLRKLPK